MTPPPVFENYKNSVPVFFETVLKVSLARFSAISINNPHSTPGKKIALVGGQLIVIIRPDSRIA